MRKIITKGTNIYVVEDSKQNGITVSGGKVFDAAGLSDKEFAQVRKDPKRIKTIKPSIIK